MLILNYLEKENNMTKKLYKEIINNIENNIDDFYTKNLLFINDRKRYLDQIKLLWMDDKITDKEYEKIIDCIEEEIGSYFRCEECDTPLLTDEYYNGYCYECIEILEDFIVFDDEDND